MPIMTHFHVPSKFGTLDDAGDNPGTTPSQGVHIQHTRETTIYMLSWPYANETLF